MTPSFSCFFIQIQCFFFFCHDTQHFCTDESWWPLTSCQTLSSQRFLGLWLAGVLLKCSRADPVWCDVWWRRFTSRCCCCCCCCWVKITWLFFPFFTGLMTLNVQNSNRNQRAFKIFLYYHDNNNDNDDISVMFLIYPTTAALKYIKMWKYVKCFFLLISFRCVGMSNKRRR